MILRITPIVTSCDCFFIYWLECNLQREKKRGKKGRCTGKWVTVKDTFDWDGCLFRQNKSIAIEWNNTVTRKAARVTWQCQISIGKEKSADTFQGENLSRSWEWQWLSQFKLTGTRHRAKGGESESKVHGDNPSVEGSVCVQMSPWRNHVNKDMSSRFIHSDWQGVQLWYATNGGITGKEFLLTLFSLDLTRGFNRTWRRLASALVAAIQLRRKEKRVEALASWSRERESLAPTRTSQAKDLCLAQCASCSLQPPTGRRARLSFFGFLVDTRSIHTPWHLDTLHTLSLTCGHNNPCCGQDLISAHFNLPLCTVPPLHTSTTASPGCCCCCCCCPCHAVSNHLPPAIKSIVLFGNASCHLAWQWLLPGHPITCSSPSPFCL